MKMRGLGIVMILACCGLEIACVSVPYQPVYSQPAAVVAVPPGAEEQPFYDDLAPYGRWVYVSGPGWAWSPYNLSIGWRPYQLGHWVFTDQGWTWASDENFGWAVYHYGRWCNDPARGWLWIPGTEWGPAWVAWHEGGGWVGWAPLPWQVRWQAGVGLDWGVLNVDVALGPSSWYFVQARDMVDPGVRYRVAPASRNVTLIQITRNVTNYTFIDNRIVDQSVKAEKIGRAVGHTIPRYRVRQADSVEAAQGGKVRGEEFVVFRPDAVRGAKSQGRLVPPGHDEKQHPRDHRPDATQPETAPRGTLPESAQPGKSEQRPSRYFKTLEQQRKRGEEPHQPPAKTTPEPAAAPDQGAVPATPSETRSDRSAPRDRRNGVAPSTGKESVNPQPGKSEQAKTPAARPSQTKAPPPKSKSKRPGDAASKPGKPKPDASDSKGPDSDKPKPEKSNSGN